MDHGLARSINRDETIESLFGVGNLIRSFFAGAISNSPNPF